MALSWFRAADLQKLVVFCDFQNARATLCGLWAGRPSKTRGFLRFSNRPRDPLRTLGWSTFENSWFFAIFNSPARPSADFGLVDLRKLVVFCDFQIARATLCGLWAGRQLKTCGFLRFPNRLRDPLRSCAWLNRSRCGGFSPERARCELEAVAEPLGLLLKCFSQLFSLNFCYQTFYSKTLYSKLFSRKFEIPWIIVCD